MLISDYKKTIWAEDGTAYGEKEFNNFENRIADLSHYAQYRQKQTYLMGQKQYKLRSFTQYCWDTLADTRFSIAMCGDSVWFGYNTLKNMALS